MSLYNESMNPYTTIPTLTDLNYSEHNHRMYHYPLIISLDR